MLIKYLIILCQITYWNYYINLIPQFIYGYIYLSPQNLYTSLELIHI